MDTLNIDLLETSQILSIPHIIIYQFSSIHDQKFTKYRFPLY